MCFSWEGVCLIKFTNLFLSAVKAYTDLIKRVLSRVIIPRRIMHTVKSTVRRMNTPVLISFSTWVHAIFSCLWTVLLFLTWLYTRFWLYMMRKHPYCEKYSLPLQTRPLIHFSTIYDILSLTYESRMTILPSTLNRIESRRFISEKISA